MANRLNYRDPGSPFSPGTGNGSIHSNSPLSSPGGVPSRSISVSSAKAGLSRASSGVGLSRASSGVGLSRASSGCDREIASITARMGLGSPPHHSSSSFLDLTKIETSPALRGRAEILDGIEFAPHDDEQMDESDAKMNEPAFPEPDTKTKGKNGKVLKSRVLKGRELSVRIPEGDKKKQKKGHILQPSSRPPKPKAEVFGWSFEGSSSPDEEGSFNRTIVDLHRGNIGTRSPDTGSSHSSGSSADRNPARKRDQRGETVLKRETAQTPDELRKALQVVRDNSPNTDLLPDDAEDILRATLCVNNSTPTSRAAHSARMMNEIWRNMVKGLTGEPAEKVHAKAYKGLESSSWCGGALGEFSEVYHGAVAQLPPEKPRPSLEVPRRVINVDHLKRTNNRGETGTGFHFCPPDHAMRSQLTNLRINPSGVFSAGWQVNKMNAPKYSTFAPDRIKSFSDFCDILINAEPIPGAQSGGRALYRESRNGPVIEMYHKMGDEENAQKDRLLVTTAFYLYGYFDFTEIGSDKVSFVISDSQEYNGKKFERVELSYPRAIHSATQAFEDYIKGETDNPIRFVMGDKVVIDIAPQIEARTGVPRGIYVVISKRDLYSEFKDSKPIEAMIEKFEEANQ